MRDTEFSDVLIALGSNLEPRIDYLHHATALIRARCGEIAAEAAVYETNPVEGPDLLFLNTALVCRTSLTPRELLTTLLKIEEELGRKRSRRGENRPIDLDIVLWRLADGGPLTVSDPDLVIPHPRFLERDFVLVPAAQIAGDWKIPGGGGSVSDALAAKGFRLQTIS